LRLAVCALAFIVCSTYHAAMSAMFCCCTEMEYADCVARPQDAHLMVQNEAYGNTVVPSLAEEAIKKASLTRAVHGFMRNAIRGSGCVYLLESTKERIATVYTVDKDLKHLIILSPKDNDGALAVCPIGMIEDLYCVEQDGEDYFPGELLNSLSNAERDLLVMIVYRKKVDDSTLYRLCLFCENRLVRDEFLECMRVLSVYCKSLPKLEVCTIMRKPSKLGYGAIGNGGNGPAFGGNALAISNVVTFGDIDTAVVGVCK